LISGDDAAVFSVSQEAFQRTAKVGWVVMVIIFSNACQASKSKEEQ
jgi:hypothetical protein